MPLARPACTRCGATRCRRISGRIDCFVGVGLTVQVLEAVRAWLRVRGDGDLLYDWEKRYLIAPEEVRVILQTHRTVQLSDDELCLRLRGEVPTERAFQEG